LPMHLSLTLLINDHGLRPNLQRLLRASCYRGLHSPGNRGGVVDLYGPKAILWESDDASDNFGDGVIQISLPPSSQGPALDEQRRQEIANDFQPRLLMYRLKNWAKVRESRVDVSELTVPTRRLACALAACFPGDPGLVRDTILLLRPQDEEIRSQRFLDVACVLVEILWGEIHSREHKQVSVSNLAKDANALLHSRGEFRDHSAEEVGWKLKRLCIPKHTDTSGRQVWLDRYTSRRVHQLAQTYDLPCTQHVGDGCSDCATPESPAAE